ncbi:MAG TPA: hypothetical protein DHV59_01015 [Oxalobacteraceae bacterium]|nr:hypothetical protein [Oxalobacteraceae bacterium]
MLKQPFAPDCFYAITPEIVKQTIEESEILHTVEMGGGVTIHCGIRFGRPVWLMENPNGLSAAWYDDSPTMH